MKNLSKLTFTLCAAALATSSAFGMNRTMNRGPVARVGFLPLPDSVVLQRLSAQHTATIVALNRARAVLEGPGTPDAKLAAIQEILSTLRAKL